VKDFLKSLFAASDPAESKGEERTARELLEAGAERIGTELQDQPEVQSEVARLIADVYFQLGDYGRALPLLRADLERRLQIEGARSVAVAESLTRIADVTYDSGQFDEAAGPRARLAIQRESVASAARRWRSCCGTSRGETQPRRPGRSRGPDQQALAIYVETKGDDSKEAVGVRESGIVYARGERLADAAALQEQVVGWRVAYYGPDHPHTLNARYNLASYLLSLGRLAEAGGIAEDVVARQRRVMGEGHDRLGVSLRVLARALDGQGDAEAALPQIAEALSIHRERFGPAHLQVAWDLAWQGMIEAHTHRLAEAVDHCVQAVALLDAEKAATPRDLATARLYAVSSCSRRTPSSRRRAHPGRQSVPDEAGTQLLLGRTLDAQGDLARRRGQTARARPLVGRPFRRSSARRPGQPHDRPGGVLILGRPFGPTWPEEEGEALLRAGIERLERDFPAGHPDLASARCLLGNALATSGRRAEALPVLMSGLGWREAHLGPTDPRTLATRRAVASTSPP
jgi:tetratricopeptide (TPR) repeat protein